jgi:hypothetical protein
MNSAEPNGALFRRVAEQGATLAENLERGQAEMPLAEHFREQQRRQQEQLFCLCVLGLDADARTRSLSWLMGAEFATLSVGMSRQPGLLELTFRDRGFSLEQSSGQWREFENLEALLEALRESGLLRADDAASPPTRIAMPLSPGLRGMRVLMPESLHLSGDGDAVFRRLSQECNALVLAAPAGAKLDDVQRAALEPLLGVLDLIVPLIIVTQGEDLPTRGWWNEPMVERAGLKRISPMVWLAGTPASLPALLSDPANSLRRVLLDIQSARRLRGATEALDERVEDLRRQLKTRRQKEERAERASAEAPTDSGRGSLEQLRNFIQDEFAALQRGLLDANRKSLAHEGAMATRLDESVQGLQVKDLVRGEGHKTVPLTVADTTLVQLGNTLKRVAREQLGRDLVMIRDGLRSADEQFQRQVERTLGVALRVDFQPPDERVLKDAIAESLRVQVSYRGEMPRRGFMQRLAEGKRLLFAALMTLSLFIGLLTGKANARAMLAPFGLLFLVLFIGTVIWTYSSWKKEDAERLEKEVDKVRDQLRGETTRLATESQRDKLARFSEHFEQLRREILRRLDEFARQLGQQRTGEMGKERAAIRERIKAVDQRLRDLDAMRPQLQKLSQDCTELLRNCEVSVKSAETR